MKERTFYFLFLCGASLLMLICDRIGAQVRHEATGSHTPSTTFSVLSAPGRSRMIRIFCYGDSLTSGTSPPEFREYPYAPHLERALRSSLMTTTTSATLRQQQIKEQPDVMVRHFGLPGWTTAQMIQELHGARGLATMLQQQAPIHIVIILAGTNDLGYSSSNDEIIRNLMALYDICWNDPMQQIQRHVIAIGIPHSSFQVQYSDVGDRVVALNQELAQWCARQPERITYVPFPIPSWDQNDDRWSPDGLHFSPKGYEVLGESLAPIVREVLIKFVPEK